MHIFFSRTSGNKISLHKNCNGGRFTNAPPSILVRVTLLYFEIKLFENPSALTSYFVPHFSHCTCAVKSPEATIFLLKRKNCIAQKITQPDNKSAITARTTLLKTEIILRFPLFSFQILFSDMAVVFSDLTARSYAREILRRKGIYVHNLQK